MPWLPTEPEKVAAFEALGIERGLLPVRVYRGAAGSTRRCFQSNCRWRSWGGAHRGLWHALQRQGRSVEVVAVVRTPREFGRARTILGKWANAATASGPAAREPGRAARREIDRIEQAIRGMDDAVIDKHGGLQGCLERIVELKDLLRSARPGTAIDGFTTWRSSRLPGAHLDRRSAGVGGVPHVYIDIGVHVHENAASMCAPAVPHVAGRVAVAPRPPERRCRSRACGRGWERPPLRDA